MLAEFGIIFAMMTLFSGYCYGRDLYLWGKPWYKIGLSLTAVGMAGITSLAMIGRSIGFILPCESLELTGTIWFALVVFNACLWFIAVLVQLGMRGWSIRHNFGWKSIRQAWGQRPGPRHTRRMSYLVSIITITVLIYGLYQASHPVVTRYQVNLAKGDGKLATVRIVAVSDVHKGLAFTDQWEKILANLVNSQNPDIILLIGDELQTRADSADEQRYLDALKSLKAPYGVWAVAGNHEYYEVDDVRQKLQILRQNGVQVLFDQTATIAGSFYLVGRADLGPTSMKKYPAQPLQELLQGLNYVNDAQTGFLPRGQQSAKFDLPVILLAHRPSDLYSSYLNGVDLQLSGHTHGGQVFPVDIIYNQEFEVVYGMARKAGYQLIVSSGFGTNGPPVRIGSHSEIVVIDVVFS